MPEYPDQFGQGPLLDPEVLGRMPEYLQPQYAQYTQPPKPEEEVDDLETLANDFINAAADLAQADRENRRWTLENDPFTAIQDPGKRFTMGERVMAAHVHEKQRRERGGEAYSALSGPEDWVAKRMPIMGGVIHAAESMGYTKIKGRIMDGSATPEDLMSFADHIATSQKRGDRAWYEKALDIASFMPGYVVEFTMSGGFAAIGKEIGKKAALRAVGNEMAQRGMGRAIIGTSGFLSGVGGRMLHPAHFGLHARNVADNLAPMLTVDTDDSNRLKMILEREGDGFAEALSKGLLLSYAELFGESVGEPISAGLGKIMPKAVKDLKNVVVRRWMGLGAKNTTDKLDDVLRIGGFHGVFMELGEEHITDALSWAIGSMYGESRERAWERMGTTGLLFEGRIGEFLKEEATMAAGFSPFMVGQVLSSYHNDQADLGNKLDQKLFEMSEAPEQAADRIEHLRGLVDYDKQDFGLFMDNAALDLFIMKDPEAAEEFLKKHVDAENPPTRKDFKDAGLPTYNISGEQRAAFTKALNKYTSTEMMAQHFEPNAIADNFLEESKSLRPLEKYVIRRRLEEYWAMNPEIDVNDIQQALHPDVMDYALADPGMREEYRSEYDKAYSEPPPVQSETRAQMMDLLDQYNSMEEGEAKDLTKAFIEMLQQQAKQELDAKDVNVEQPPVEEMPPEAPVDVPEAPVDVPEAPVDVPEAPVAAPEAPIDVPEAPAPPVPAVAEEAPELEEAPAPAREEQILGELEGRNLSNKQLKALLRITTRGFFVPQTDTARKVEIRRQRLSEELRDAEVLLGIPPGSSLAELESAFRKFSLKYHPDKKGGSREQFKKGGEAYSLLEAWMETTGSETTPVFVAPEEAVPEAPEAAPAPEAEEAPPVPAVEAPRPPLGQHEAELQRRHWDRADKSYYELQSEGRVEDSWDKEHVRLEEKYLEGMKPSKYLETYGEEALDKKFQELLDKWRVEEEDRFPGSFKDESFRFERELSEKGYTATPSQEWYDLKYIRDWIAQDLDYDRAGWADESEYDIMWMTPRAFTIHWSAHESIFQAQQNYEEAKKAHEAGDESITPTVLRHVEYLLQQADDRDPMQGYDEPGLDPVLFDIIREIYAVLNFPDIRPLDRVYEHGPGEEQWEGGVEIRQRRSRAAGPIFPQREKHINHDTVINRRGKFFSPEEAKKTMDKWKAEAKRRGKEEDNSNKVIFSLFDRTGEWSKPWRDAGYTVIQLDLNFGNNMSVSFEQHLIDIALENEMEIFGVLAAPPCTTFTGSGAQWRKERFDKPDPEMVAEMWGWEAREWFDTPLDYNVHLLASTQAFIEQAAPTGFYALENPIGRINEFFAESLNQKAALIFNPWNYGQQFSKRTNLFGEFSTDLPLNPVDVPRDENGEPLKRTKGGKPTYPSYAHELRGTDPIQKALRSVTPEGFAYAFFMANHPTAKTGAFVPKGKEKADTVIIDGKKHTKEMLRTYSKEKLLELAAKARPSQYPNIDKENFKGEKTWVPEYLSTYGKEDFIRNILTAEELQTEEFLGLIEEGLVAPIPPKEEREAKEEAAKPVPAEPPVRPLLNKEIEELLEEFWAGATTRLTERPSRQKLKKIESRNVEIRKRIADIRGKEKNPVKTIGWVDLHGHALENEPADVVMARLEDYILDLSKAKLRRLDINQLLSEARSVSTEEVLYEEVEDVIAAYLHGTKPGAAPAAKPVPAEPTPAAEEAPTAKPVPTEEHRERDWQLLVDTISGWSAQDLLNAKKDLKSPVMGFSAKQVKNAIDSELERWAKKEEVDPSQVEQLEEEAGFDIDIGHYSETTNKADIEAYLMENYEDVAALKRLAPELGAEFKSKVALASAIAEAQAKSVRANHILEHGTKNAPKVVTKKSDKSDFKMEGRPVSENPGKMNKTEGKVTEEDVKVEAVLKGMKGEPTPEKIKNLIQHLFGVPIREGFARQLTKTVLGIYKPVSKVIRMAKGGLLKLGTLMHELAHHLDNTLGITGEVGHKKRAAGLTKEMEDELKTLDYDVQAFVVALENAVESDVFRRKKIGMPKTRSELLGLVEQWNKKDGIFKEATVVNEIKNVSNKIKARMSEGFAEVVRIYMTDGMQMAARDDLPPAFDITNDFLQDKVFGAPKFMKWFLEDFLAQEGAHLEVARNLSSIRGAIKKWRKSTPEARVMSIFSTTWEKKKSIFTGDENWRKDMKDFLTRAYVAVVDKYYPLKAASDQVKEVMAEIRKDIDTLNKQFKEAVSEAEKKEIKKKLKEAEAGLSNRSTTYDWVMSHSFAAEGMTEDAIRYGPEAITKAPTKEGDVPGSRRLGPSLISALELLTGVQLKPWKGFMLSLNTLEIQLQGEEQAQRLKDSPGGGAIKRKTHEGRTEAISDQDASVVVAMVKGGFTQEGLETMVKIGLSPGQIINEVLISKYKDRDGESLKIIGDISISALKTAMATKEWSSQNKQLVIDAINKMEKRENIRPEAETFIKAHDIVTRYHGGLVQVLVDAELLTQERADKIKSRKHYVPMMRHMLDETGRFRKKIRKNKNVALQLYLPFGYLSKEGSTDEIVDPIESTIRLTTEVVNTAITQVALLNLGKDMIPEWGGIEGWEGTIREVDPNFGKNAVQLEAILTQLADMNVIEKEKADLFKAVWTLRRYNAGDKDTSFWHTRTKTGLPGLKVGKGEFLVFNPGRLKQLEIILESVDIEGSSAEGMLENIREMFGEEGQAKEGIAAINKQFKILEEMTESIPDAATMFTTYFPKWEAASGEEGYYQAVIYKEGKPNLVEMHEEFYNSIHLLVNKHTAGPIQGILRSIAKVVKTGAVRWNMMFAVKNVLRDLITNNFQAKHQSAVEGVSSPFYWLAVSFLHHAAKEKWPILKNFKGANINELVDLYEKNGGNMNSWFFNSKDGVETIHKMLEKKHTADARNGGIFSSVKEFANWYVDVIALSDVGPRLAEFYGVFKEHGYDINKQGQMVYVLDSDGKRQHVSKGVLRTPPSDVIVLARAAAADVTTNFGRGGWMGKYFEQETVFLGAAIQGFDKQIRTIRDEYKRLKGAKDVGEFASEAVKSRLMWAALVSMAYEIAYYMSRAEDDDFKTQPWWERYTYWTFTDKNGKPIIKLPKGYGWSVVGNTTHAIWDSFYRNDPEAMTELFWHTLESDVPFSPQSMRNRFPPATLAWEYAANKSLFFDTPIERRNVVGRPKHLRYNDETDWLMRNLGWVTGKTFNISPVQLEHGINSLTGGMYKQLSEKAGVVATTDFSLGGFAKTGGEFIPLVPSARKAFSIKKDHTRDTNKFYDMRQAASEKAEEEKLMEGGASLETQMRRNTLELYAGLFSEIRKITREIPAKDRDERFKYDKYVIGASRNALGLEPLDRYPNPFAEDLVDLPPEIRAAVRDAKESQKRKANLPLPGGKYKRHKTWMETWKWWRATRDAARRWLLSQRESRM